MSSGSPVSAREPDVPFVTGFQPQTDTRQNHRGQGTARAHRILVGWHSGQHEIEPL
jgi:hypothetical protein